MVEEEDDEVAAGLASLSAGAGAGAAAGTSRRALTENMSAPPNEGVAPRPGPVSARNVFWLKPGIFEGGGAIDL